MKEKTKEFLKKYLIGFILGVVSAGVVIVYAETYFPSNDVTYDNTESGLTSTNVQGAIDELYGVCTTKPAGEQIIEDAGLKKDPYECRYFFTGADPNNYITFNDEKAKWRIISIECDGTIKIMRINDIDTDIAWDSTGGIYGSNNWARPADLNTYLNNTYLNSLSSTAQNQIVAKDFGIGAVTWANNNLADQINNENGTKWNGKIALVTLSEYIRVNSNQNDCGTLEKLLYNYGSCRHDNWISKSFFNYISVWTLTPEADNDSAVYAVVQYGNLSTYGGYGSHEVRPVLYLSSDVTLTGSGTQSDPYVVK